MGNTDCVDKARAGTLTCAEKDLVKTLREEAYDVKDCFTKMSFQTLAVATVLLGLIVRFQGDVPFAGLAVVPLIVLLLAVVRIGLHKYETANRLYGYELHMHRRVRLRDSQNKGWKSHMRNIGWEEAFYAWRVVQPVIYIHLYRKLFVRPTKKTDYNIKTKQKWYEPKTLEDEKLPTYRAGSYRGCPDLC